MKKRLICLMLSLMMVITLLPTSALADELKNDPTQVTDQGEPQADQAPAADPEPEQQQPGEGSGEAQQPGEGSGEAQQPGEGSGEAQQPGEGTGEGQQPGEGTGEGQQPGEGTGEGEQPSEGTGEGQQPGEGTGEGQQPGEGTGEGQQPSEGTGEGQQPGEGTGEGQQPGEGTGEGQQPGEGTGEGSGEAQQPGEGSGEGQQPGEGSGESQQPGEGTGEGQQPGEGTGEGEQPGEGTGEGQQPGEGTGDAEQPGEGTGDAEQQEQSDEDKPDLTADRESDETWANSVAKAKLTGDWAKDLVAVARTQLGYTASDRNYIVTEDGHRKLYTRYGTWAGDSYGNWCAAFVAFCVKFAKVGMPWATSCQNFKDALAGKGLYHAAGEYEPKAGDVVFFSADGRTPNHMGIVIGASGSGITTIEGNRTNKVETFSYNLSDRTILGYGEMPENPDYVAPEDDGTDLPGEGNDEIELPGEGNDEIEQPGEGTEPDPDDPNAGEEEPEEEAVTYTVTFHGEDDWSAHITVEEGAAIGEQLPAAPAREGYQFKGWYSVSVELDENGEEKQTHAAVDGETVVSGDLDVYAEYEEAVAEPEEPEEPEEPKTIDVTVTAVFEDEDNAKEIRPEAVKVQLHVAVKVEEEKEELKAEEAAVKEVDADTGVMKITIQEIKEVEKPEDVPADFDETVLLSGENGWKYAWTGLPVGEVTVTAEEVEGYALALTGDAQEGFVLTYSYIYTLEYTHPEATFSDEVDGTSVEVSAPVGAFPKGTTMKVALVDVETIQDALVGALDEGTTIVKVKAVDITFYDADGNEIEPACEICVSLKDKMVEDAAGAQLVHVDDEGNGTVVATATEETAADEVAFVSDNFSTYAIVISTRVITAQGETYVVDLTYSDAAHIPSGAYLTAVELDPESEEYETYYEGSLAENDNVAPALARIFDITIHAPDGTEIEPDAPVRISIRLDESMAESEEMEIRVVHFGEEDAELLTPLPATRSAAEDGAIVFDAGSLSVYCILSYNNAIAPDQLDGRTLSIIYHSSEPTLPSGTGNDNSKPGTWYAMLGVAPEGVTERLAALKLKRSTKYYIDEPSADIAEWTFEYAGMDGSNYTYYIQLAGRDPAQYLHISSSTGVTLSTEPQAITVSPVGNDGRVRLIADSKGLVYQKTSDISTFYIGPTGTNVFLTDVDEYTPDLPEYTAVKYASYEMQGVYGKYVEGQPIDDIVIYATVYNPLSGSYEDFVIDGAGNAIRAYDNGASISFRSEISPIWHMTACTYDGTATGEATPYFIFQNTGTEKVLWPATNGDQVIADYHLYTDSGVLLAGREAYQNNSTMERWDDDVHQYCGYRFVIEDGHMVLRPGAGDDSVALSFARKMPPTTGQLHPVATVDSKSNGVTIRMFDYGGGGEVWKASASSADLYTWIDTYTGPTEQSGTTGSELRRGRVTSTLRENGFPIFTQTNINAATLFGENSAFYKGEGNWLFLEAPYAATGYYSYSCFNNYAYWENGEFTVYEEIGSVGNKGITHRRGHFLPFNTIDVTRPQTGEGHVNTYDNRLAPLDLEDPNYGDPIYQAGTGVYNGISGTYPNLTYTPPASDLEPVNYFFGMTVDCTFMKPHNGLQNGDPVIYEFTGDDDLWIYVDGVLLLDLGGVHSAVNGKINFANGQISGHPSINDQNKNNTIKKCFQNAVRQDGGVGIFPDGTPWVDDETIINKYFDGETFRDFTRHTFKMLYMEHGAGSSNLVMRFNLPTVEEAQFAVEKQLADTVQGDYANVPFAYQAFYKDANGNFQLLLPDTVFPDFPNKQVEVYYEGTDTEAEFFDNKTIGPDNISYDGVFYLKPGEAVVFKNIPDAVEYYVQEVGLPEGFCDQVVINGVAGIEEANGVYPSTVDTVAGRARVVFINDVSAINRNSLLITKDMTEGSVDDGSTFTFRVLMENTAGELVAYNTGLYYVKGQNGHYYKYVNNALVDNGDTPVAYYSSPNGLIDSIPIGFTVEIPNLIAGTAFYVDEVLAGSNGLPANWQYVDTVLTEDTYDPVDPPLSGTARDYSTEEYATATYTAQGQIKEGQDVDAQVTITNKYLSTTVTVVKSWADNDNQDGIRPKTIQIKLLADGTELTDKLATLSAGADADLHVDEPAEVRGNDDADRVHGGRSRGYGDHGHRWGRDVLLCDHGYRGRRLHGDEHTHA